MKDTKISDELKNITAHVRGELCLQLTIKSERINQLARENHFVFKPPVHVDDPERTTSDSGSAGQL